jgi:hypothetical protein
MKQLCISLITACMLLCGGCATGKLPLPQPEDIATFQYGSYIELRAADRLYVKGELIAIDSCCMVVLPMARNLQQDSCMLIPLEYVKDFRLRYAQHKNYGWFIPLTFPIPLIHGYWSIFTLPLNLIVGISVTEGANKAFSYSQKNITMEELAMFARFPQGIPKGVALNDIKR